MELKDLAAERTTFIEFDDSSKSSVIDNWMTSDDPKARQSRHFKAKIIFKLASQKIGRKLVGKQSTPPEPLEPEPKKVQDPKLQVQVVPQPPQSILNPVHPKLVQFKDTFREKIFPNSHQVWGLLLTRLVFVLASIFGECTVRCPSLFSSWCPGGVPGVPVVSRWCPGGVPVVSRSDGVPVVSRSCPGGVPVVSRWCPGGVPVVSRWCNGVPVVFQWCRGGVPVV